MKPSFCAGEVLRLDRDRYLLGQFIRPPAREDYFALCAFNAEIAKTREVVTDAGTGQFRLQWWRDVIARFYETGGVEVNPVMAALAGAIRRHGLDRASFDDLIDAREFDLQDRTPADMDELAAYAEMTSWPLMQLVCKATGGKPGDGDRRRATGYALTGLIRAIPAHARQQRVFLPADLMREAGLTAHDVFEFRQRSRISQVVEKMAAAAFDCLEATGGRDGGHAALSATLARLHLEQIRSCGYDMAHPRLGAPPFLRELRLLMAYFRG